MKRRPWLRRKADKVRAIASLALGLTLSVVPRLRAQNAIDDRVVATTFCSPDGRPMTSTAPLLDSITSIRVAAHEAAHRRRLQGNCAALKAVWARDPIARLDAEAEGYCAGVAALEPLTPGGRLLELAGVLDRLEQLFPALLPIDVADAVARYCLPKAPVPS